jgi:hypothetical protein
MRAIASKYNRYTRVLKVAAMSISLVIPATGFAQEVEEEPSPLAMAGDALIARPLGIAITAVGTVIYLVTLPFSLAGGNAGDAGKALVVYPAEATFVRCLGCTQSGYKSDHDVE